MSGDDALIDLLLTQGDRVSRATVDDILGRGEAIAPRLAKLLADENLWIDEGSRWWAVVHAYSLLARLKPPGALDLLLDALDRAHLHAIDWISHRSSGVLASFGPSALSQLKATARDVRRNTWARVSALQAVAQIGYSHAEARNEALEFLREVGRNPTEVSELRTFTGHALLSFAQPEDRELIVSLAGDFVYNEEDVEEVYAGAPRPPEGLDED